MPTLNIHLPCDIIDTNGSCKPMNLGHLWICLVGITPSNNPGTERENCLICYWNSPALPDMVIGQPHW